MKFYVQRKQTSQLNGLIQLPGLYGPVRVRWPAPDWAGRSGLCGPVWVEITNFYFPGWAGLASLGLGLDPGWAGLTKTRAGPELALKNPGRADPNPARDKPYPQHIRSILMKLDINKGVGCDEIPNVL